MTIVYLDVDDEITSAAARIRTAEEIDVALVLPAGSRIATSRINFRLLAREASERSRRLAIVAPEASTRALAASAGLPVFASVLEYGEARGRSAGGPVGAPLPAAAAAATAMAAAAVAPAPASVPPGIVPAPADELPPAQQLPDAPPSSTREGGRPRAAVGASTGLSAGRPVTAPRRRRWPLLVALLIGVMLLAGTSAAVGYVLLPTATVTVHLASEPVGPIVFTGTADPDVVAVDAASATIPAVRVPVPLAAAGTFKATGKRVESSVATGDVRFQNCDPARAYTITRGSVVRTAAGLAFLTQEDVFLPVAILDLPQIICQFRSVGVQAQRDGPAGNVAARTITRVPADANSNVIFVTNLAATTGGAREEFPVITEKDVASATTRLTKQLNAQLASAAAAPPGTPAGATAYPETARRGEPVPSEPLADIVGREAETFDLALTAEGTVVAADPAPLEAIGAARVTAAVPEGKQVREGSIRVAVGPGVVEGETIRYPVAARAEAVQDITADQVRELVRGKTPAQAREILADYGSVEIVIWPDWASSITTIDGRLVITVEGLPPAEPAPGPTRAPTPAPSSQPEPSVPARSPGPSGSPPSSAVP